MSAQAVQNAFMISRPSPTSFGNANVDWSLQKFKINNIILQFKPLNVITISGDS